MRLTIAVLLAGVALSAQAEDRYELDSSHTFPSFSISHMGYSTHSGRFNDTRGSFVVDKKGGGSKVEVTIKTASIDTGGEALEKVLRGADFFNAEKFPELRYRSTKVRWTGENTAEIEGDLTLLGVTKPVPLRIVESKCGSHPVLKSWMCGFAVEGMLKRSDFGMKAGIPLVGDEVQIRIQAEGSRKAGGDGPKH